MKTNKKRVPVFLNIKALTMANWLFCYFSILTYCNAQTPATDPNFHLVWSDDFTSHITSTGKPDPSKWTLLANNDGYVATRCHQSSCGYKGYTGSVADSDNVSVSGGILTISAKKKNYSCPESAVAVGQYQCSAEWAAQQAGQSYQYQYTSGGVTALYYPQYGYVEAKIKFDYVDFVKYHPGFVLYGQNDPNPYPAAQEIDIFEFVPVGLNPPVQDIQLTNIHINYVSDTLCSNAFYSTGACYGNYNLLSTDYSNWHVYGLEWTPTQIIWYTDGVVVRNSVNPGINSYPSNINLGSAVDKFNSVDGSQDNMYVDYVNVYQLNADCNDIINTCNYTFPATDNEVKKSITIGTGNNNNCINSTGSSNVIFWASDYINLSGDFSVPIGSTFFAGVNDYCDPVLNPANPIAGCSTYFEACTTINFLGLNNQIFKDIDIGGTGCNVDITPTSGNDQLLYASDKVIIEQGIHIQATTSNKVHLKITSCP
jgi:beta-glucanase (GH16 family)